MRTRTSALVVLGVYAGVIAGLAIVPVTIPLLYRLVQAEDQASQAAFYTETARFGLALDRDETPDAPDALALRAIEAGGRIRAEHSELTLPPALEDRVCGHPSAVMPVVVEGVSRVAACFENPRIRVFAVYPAPTRSYLSIGAGVIATG